MVEPVDVAAVGALVGDRVRAAILTRLLDGDECSASALADAAQASPSLASAHLKKLLDGGLVTVEARGRERRYRLASSLVAEMLEVMLLLAPDRPVTSLRGANDRRRIRRARLCYDHMAGVLGIAVTDALVRRGVLESVDGAFAVGGAADAVLGELAIEVEPLRAANRPVVRACMDLTERRHHVSGGLGAAVARRLLEERWIIRRSGSRGVEVTADGAAGLREWLGVDLEANADWHAAGAAARAAGYRENDVGRPEGRPTEDDHLTRALDSSSAAERSLAHPRSISSAADEAIAQQIRRAPEGDSAAAQTPEGARRRCKRASVRCAR